MWGDKVVLTSLKSAKTTSKCLHPWFSLSCIHWLAGTRDDDVTVYMVLYCCVGWTLLNCRCLSVLMCELFKKNAGSQYANVSEHIFIYALMYVCASSQSIYQVRFSTKYFKIMKISWTQMSTFLKNEKLTYWVALCNDIIAYNIA